MNKVSRTITGTVMILLGIFLSLVAVFEEIFLLIYGIPLIILGLFIFFNKKEDAIEEIKKK